ncbi:hypothetical protein F5B22DRAFT_648534 [Xylaria bambusicola]|uniref:uncharacterized protein n=1 Tax=Xylaria bambusicola TaxID=326684 RepID=UPI0020076301|nr:uncharacterized protein F5B22DRAFT_648534 [Xylaria bambusicola]KAI0512685.1 hypothetical protein F5B22DRAFT_648534 [Xylaria bambusicola]
MTDVRKAGGAADASRSRRPQTLTRKSTPQALHKLGKSPRDREREWEEQQWSEDERESFPQYCMTCEKQFIAQDERFLYCSEACRRHDQNASSSHSSARMHGSHHNTGNLSFYATGKPEPRDIIPRASPSRPSSNYFSPPTTPTSSQYPSAVSALRSLSRRPPSPPSPVSTNASIWPFARSAATSPSSSYTQPPSVYPSTYDGGYQYSAYNYTGSMMTSDRPLPSRNPPAYSRPKSIELVTPMLSRY